MCIYGALYDTEIIKASSGCHSVSDTATPSWAHLTAAKNHFADSLNPCLGVLSHLWSEQPGTKLEVLRDFGEHRPSSQQCLGSSQHSTSCPITQEFRGQAEGATPHFWISLSDAVLNLKDHDVEGMTSIWRKHEL